MGLTKAATVLAVSAFATIIRKTMKENRFFTQKNVDISPSSSQTEEIFKALTKKYAPSLKVMAAISKRVRRKDDQN